MIKPVYETPVFLEVVLDDLVTVSGCSGMDTCVLENICTGNDWD